MRINLNDKKVWQVGSGDDSRNYVDVFFNYGVALVGPGDPGRYGSEEAKQYYAKHTRTNNWGAELAKACIGEWVIARKGRQQVLGVGKIIGPYDYSEMFEDVEGWDLQHFIRVEWHRPIKPIKFPKSHLSMSTFVSCNHTAVIETLNAADYELVDPQFTICQKNELPLQLRPEDLLPKFIDSGIRIQDAENIVNTIRRIIRLAAWYFHNDHGASEHELRSFLVVPLLISLGWSEQKIKIEHHYMDVALFDHPFRPDSKSYNPCPRFIIETKTYDNGLSFTGKQVKNYGDKYPDCKYFITTNGYRYRYYEKVAGKLQLKGYINLLNLREKDLLDADILGAYDTLLCISNLAANYPNI